MRYAIISDIHANLEALEAVLADAQSYTDTFICLGDIVGYNANPNECLKLTQDMCSLIVVGNHDQAAVGIRPYDDFNEYAAEAIKWTSNQLTPAGRTYLQSLPRTATFGKSWLAAHGSPRDTDEYLLYTTQFRASFVYLQQQTPEVHCCFVGHTHLPMIWSCTPEGGVSAVDMPSLTMTLDPGCRYIVNPGSVGQPRSGNSAATYVLLDDETRTVEFRFITYDIDAAQEKIYDAGLPLYLAERLAEGR
jgi:diadenosine tetraphosphatase ApaH/serine/threonine PP2A family protein phosphatase